MTDIVLFDAVGTLIYPDPPVARVYHDAGRRFGSQLDERQIANRFRAALERFHFPADPDAPSLRSSSVRERERWQAIVDDVFRDVRNGDRGRLFNSLWDHFAAAEHWALFADVAPTWCRLLERGLRIGIASNFDERLEPICRCLPPLDSAQAVFVSSDIGFAKPSPRFYAEVQNRLGVAAERIVMVGDNPACDWQGPRRAGWRAVLLDRSGTTRHSIASLDRLGFP